jgi:hypothetical protein
LRRKRVDPSLMVRRVDAVIRNEWGQGRSPFRQGRARLPSFIGAAAIFRKLRNGHHKRLSLRQTDPRIV